MVLPHRIATLLYCFNHRDEVLLLKRARQPNQNLWSPCGGKIDIDAGESPYAGACREAMEEIELRIVPSDLHLTGLVSEEGHEGTAHWLMFLFEVKPRLESLPKPHPEGVFEFFAPETIGSLDLPSTDRERLWPLFWAHRGGFFAVRCRVDSDGKNHWTLEESLPLSGGPMTHLK
ncbi:MAG: NUDIX hydrolase [Verrucomicrobia bacterium]|jgi:8-oxo-dGTP diphosphatase|nr:NUDIX hydrolase [Verrucomicrobiota bacterium]